MNECLHKPPRLHLAEQCHHIFVKISEKRTNAVYAEAGSHRYPKHSGSANNLYTQ